MWNRHASAVAVGCALMSAIIAGQSPTPPDKGASALDSSEVLQHLASTYAAIAPFDLDDDREFNAVERTDLLAGLENGTVPLMPFLMRPGGTTPPSHVMLLRIAWVYAMTRPFDANDDGALNEEELHALAAGLECGAGPHWRQPSAVCAEDPREHDRAGGSGRPRFWGPPWR